MWMSCDLVLMQEDIHAELPSVPGQLLDVRQECFFPSHYNVSSIKLVAEIYIQSQFPLLVNIHKVSVNIELNIPRHHSNGKYSIRFLLVTSHICEPINTYPCLLCSSDLISIVDS